MAITLKAVGIVHATNKPVELSVFANLQLGDKLLYTIEVGGAIYTPEPVVKITNLQSGETLVTGWKLASGYFARYKLREQ